MRTVLGMVFVALLPLCLGIDYQDIPASRMPPEPWQEFAWEDPGGWTTIDVTTRGIAPGTTDITTSLRTLIDGLSGPTVLYFPAGRYVINDLKLDYDDTDILFRGAGDSTVFDVTTGANAISLYGTWAEGERPILAGVAPGGKAVRVADASSYAQGDIVSISEDLVNYVDWGKRGRGGVFRVVSVSGGDITLDRPLAIGLDQVTEKQAVVYELLAIKNIAIEGIRFIHTSTVDDNTLIMRWASNIMIRNCSFINSSMNHVRISESRNVIVRDSFFYEAQKKEGGHGYSVVAENRCTGILITNNIMQDTNVCLGVQVGTSYLVYSYNYCVDRLYEICNNAPVAGCSDRDWYTDKSKNGIMDGDFGMGFTFHGHYPHHNLVEGNVIYGAVIDHIWKDNGPHNTFFRNRIEGLPPFHTAVWLGGAGIHIDGPSDSQNIIGNNFLHDSFIEIGMHSYDPPRRAEDTFLAANDVIGVRDFTGGVVRGPVYHWDNLSMDASLPASLYQETKPDFWPQGLAWPPYGPDVSGARTNKIPAQLRWEAMQSLRACTELGGSCCAGGTVCSGTVSGSTDCAACCIGSCIQSLCGNAACDSGETCATCPADCIRKHDADTTPCDGCVRTDELAGYLGRWRSGQVTINLLMQAIRAYKSGC